MFAQKKVESKSFLDMDINKFKNKGQKDDLNINNSDTPEEFKKKYKKNITEENNINLLQAASSIPLTKLAQTSIPKRVWDFEEMKKMTKRNIDQLKKDINQNIKSQDKFGS